MSVSVLISYCHDATARRKQVQCADVPFIYRRFSSVFTTRLSGLAVFLLFLHAYIPFFHERQAVALQHTARRLRLRSSCLSISAGCLVVCLTRPTCKRQAKQRQSVALEQKATKLGQVALQGVAAAYCTRPTCKRQPKQLKGNQLPFSKGSPPRSGSSARCHSSLLHKAHIQKADKANERRPVAVSQKTRHLGQIALKVSCILLHKAQKQKAGRAGERQPLAL